LNSKLRACRQALYHLRHDSIPFCCIFELGSHFMPVLAWTIILLFATPPTPGTPPPPSHCWDSRHMTPYTAFYWLRMGSYKHFAKAVLELQSSQWTVLSHGLGRIFKSLLFSSIPGTENNAYIE
jgi:hypothetical protein